MEGVGARLGRSSTRYGPATVFTGPVRKWKKKWVHVSPHGLNQNHHNTASNGSTTAATTNGNNGSHLLLYKWTPITPSQNNANNTTNSNNNPSSNGESKDDAAPAPEEERPRRKFKYIPIAVLEEYKNEESENADDEDKPSDMDSSAVNPTPKSDGSDEKPDINDLPVEESQENSHVVRQDLNESTLDLSLGLKAHDGNDDSEVRADKRSDGR